MTDLIGFADATPEMVREYLELADQFASPDGKPTTPDSFRKALDGRTIGLLFFEPSTRTRASFEIAVTRLGGYPLRFSGKGTSIEKGETVLDTCQNLAAMGVDAFVIRHSDRHLPYGLADQLDQPIINAGNGIGEHPTQALLDAMTLQRAWSTTDLTGKKISIVGDIRHSRVARSDVAVFQLLGAEVTVAGPNFLMPDDTWGATPAATRPEALADADAVIFLRIQKERFHKEFNVDDYIRDWAIDGTVLESEMKPGAKVMHPGPVIRGVEMTSDVADGPSSLILNQVGFGVAVRQAALVKSLETA